LAVIAVKVSLFNIQGDFQPGNCQGLGSLIMVHSGKVYPIACEAMSQPEESWDWVDALKHIKTIQKQLE